MKSVNAMKLCLFPVVALSLIAWERPALQQATSGSINRHYVYSPQMGDTITVDVWLPEGFDDATGNRYPVIYMHDGQNLFDATTSWNCQSWEMDSITNHMAMSGEIIAPVIVGIHSVNQTRLGDLMPENALDFLTDQPDSTLSAFISATPLRGNAYAAFIVETLKPMMDSIYPLSANRDSTFLMGSSMGGLMSIYAMSEYPEVFGGAACLSTHWVGTLDGNPAFPTAMYRYLAEKLPRDGQHRLYLDHGTLTIDSLYGPWEERIISLADSLGYKTTSAAQQASYPEYMPTLETYIDEGAGHEERYWAKRVSRPLRFLLK